jgi:hypothetical protein
MVATQETRTRRAGASALVVLAGLHAALFLLAYALVTSTPGPSAPDEELVAFYGSSSRIRLVLLGLFVMPFAGICFLWVSSALRAWIRAATQGENEFVGGLQQASGIIYVALFFAAAAASSVMAVSVEYSNSPLDPMLARQLPQFGKTLLLVFGMRMAATFVFTTTQMAHRTGVLPRWFELAGTLAGVFLLLSTAFNRELVLVFPIWLLLLSIQIWSRTRGDEPVPAA